MIIPSKERYNTIIEDFSEVKIRNQFIKKLSNGMYSLENSLQFNYSYRNNFNFYISNNQNELIYVVRLVERNNGNRKFYVSDPFGNIVGEIEKDTQTLENPNIYYNIYINGKEKFNVCFDIKMTTRAKRKADEFISINNLPLKFENEFFNEEYKINMKISIIHNFTEDIVLQSDDIKYLGYYDLILDNKEYRIEALFIFLCLMFEKIEFDGGIVIKF